jgi:hypothetical protein
MDFCGSDVSAHKIRQARHHVRILLRRKLEARNTTITTFRYTFLRRLTVRQSSVTQIFERHRV